MMENLRRAAGNTMVVGISGKELTGLERAWLKLIRPAGVILFQRNIDNAAQTRALLSQATEVCAPHALRCVDVEGGTVDRLHEALAPMPSAKAVFAAASASVPRSQKRDPSTNSGQAPGQPPQKPALMREHGELVARGVRAFGFNTTLAPVLDLGLPASAEVMGTRVVSADPKAVANYCGQFLAGLAAHKVLGCGKHFPGLGGGTLDSHLETPSINRTMRELTNDDLYPYCELRDQLPMIMVSHAAYPMTPGGDRPASVSPYWITTILRKRIGYKGLTFSDDLEMGGVLKFLPIEGAAIEAIRAGMDLIEICHRPELILRAYEALVAEAERSAAFRKILLSRSRQSTRLRTQHFARPTPPALSTKQFAALKNEINRFAATISGELPKPEGRRR
jgi:beta-N-acetylhexosaminidase